MGFLTRDDRALVIDCTTPRVDVALRDGVTLFPSVHVPSRMKKPRTGRGQFDGMQGARQLSWLATSRVKRPWKRATPP
jgi:hypothetical protein